MDPDDESLFTSLRESNSSMKNTFFSENDSQNQMSWSKVPGRDFLHNQSLETSYYGELEGNSRHGQYGSVINGSPLNSAASVGVEQIAVYAYSELIIREITSKMYMTFPLPLCRALLLDSSLIRNGPKRLILEEHHKKIDDHF